MKDVPNVSILLCAKNFYSRRCSNFHKVAYAIPIMAVYRDKFDYLLNKYGLIDKKDLDYVCALLSSKMTVDDKHELVSALLKDLYVLSVELNKLPEPIREQAFNRFAPLFNYANTISIQCLGRQDLDVKNPKDLKLIVDAYINSTKGLSASEALSEHGRYVEAQIKGGISKLKYKLGRDKAIMLLISVIILIGIGTFLILRSKRTSNG